jgi:hypothetical protein
MSSKQPTTNSILRDRLYGEHYPDAFLDVPGPVRKSNVATLGDYIQQLCQKPDEPYKRSEPCVACEPIESNKCSESSFQHICPNNPILNCNCVDPKYCSELGSDPDRQFNDKSINKHDDKCSSHDGFSDNLDYVGNPYPNTKGKDAVSGWPCVVVGGFCEAGTSPAERILGTTASEWNTERDTNARQDVNGTFISTNH